MGFNSGFKGLILFSANFIQFSSYIIVINCLVLRFYRFCVRHLVVVSHNFLITEAHNSASVRHFAILHTAHILIRFQSLFAKLRKATISFVICVRPSVRIKNTRLPLDRFSSNWYLSVFRKSVEKIQVTLQSDNNNSGTLHEDRYTF